VHRARDDIAIQESTNEIGARINPTTHVTMPLLPKSGDANASATETRTAPIATFASCKARIEAADLEGADIPGV